MIVLAIKENMRYGDAGQEIDWYDYKFKNNITQYSKQQFLFIYQTIYESFKIWECARPSGSPGAFNSHLAYKRLDSWND